MTSYSLAESVDSSVGVPSFPLNCSQPSCRGIHSTLVPQLSQIGLTRYHLSCFGVLPRWFDQTIKQQKRDFQYDEDAARVRIRVVDVGARTLNQFVHWRW